MAVVDTGCWATVVNQSLQPCHAWSLLQRLHHFCCCCCCCCCWGPDGRLAGGNLCLSAKQQHSTALQSTAAISSYKRAMQSQLPAQYRHKPATTLVKDGEMRRLAPRGAIQPYHSPSQYYKDHAQILTAAAARGVKDPSLSCHNSVLHIAHCPGSD